MNKIEVERELDSVMLYSQEPFIIDVAKVVCWGVEPEHCRISFTEQSLNEKYAKKVNYYDTYQYHVGYILYNGGGTTIENIVCPFFSYDKNLEKWVGVEKLVNLEPGQTISLPIRYVIFLLLSHGQSLKIDNGEFITTDEEIEESDKNNIDYLSTFRFVPSDEWNDEFKKDSSYYQVIGCHVVDRNNIYLGFSILPEPFNLKERYGFLLNEVTDSRKEVNKEELVKELDYENIGDSIKFLGSLLWRKDFT